MAADIDAAKKRYVDRCASHLAASKIVDDHITAMVSREHTRRLAASRGHCQTRIRNGRANNQSAAIHRRTATRSVDRAGVAAAAVKISARTAEVRRETIHPDSCGGRVLLWATARRRFEGCDEQPDGDHAFRAVPAVLCSLDQARDSGSSSRREAS